MAEIPVVIVDDGAAEIDFHFPAGAYVVQPIRFLNADGTDYVWGSVTGKGEVHRRPGTPVLAQFLTSDSTLTLATGLMTITKVNPSTPVNARYDIHTLDGSGHRTRRVYGQWDIEPTATE